MIRSISAAMIIVATITSFFSNVQSDPIPAILASIDDAPQLEPLMPQSIVSMHEAQDVLHCNRCGKPDCKTPGRCAVPISLTTKPPVQEDHVHPHESTEAVESESVDNSHCDCADCICGHPDTAELLDYVRELKNSSYGKRPLKSSYDSTSSSVASYGSTGSTIRSYGSTGYSFTPTSVTTTDLTARYGRRWFNKDGLTLRQHAEQVHGYSTSGMTDAQVAMANDAYHDSYGPYHNATQTASAPRRVVTRTSTQSCPIDPATGLSTCPTSSTTNSRSKTVTTNGKRFPIISALRPKNWGRN